MFSQNCFMILFKFFAPSPLSSSSNRIPSLCLLVLHFKYSFVKKNVKLTNDVPLLITDFSLPDSKKDFNASKERYLKLRT